MKGAHATAMARIGLRLFGGFEASAPGAPPVQLPARAQALLARLALGPGQSHLRDKLAALLWAEAPAARARHSLRQSLLTIRQTLPEGEPPLLIERGDTVALNPDAVDVDAEVFEQLVKAGTPASLEDAAALYGGDLLEGIVAQDGPFEDWLLTERERLRELALDALGRLLAHQVGAGKAEEAIRTAGRLLALEPAEEAVHRSLMRLHARQGRRRAALRQYELCRAALKRDLGLEPEPATAALYQEILQSAAAPPIDPFLVPAPEIAVDPPATRASKAPLIGRQSEMAILDERRARAWSGQGQAVAILGAAGIGKTRLIEALIEDALAHGGRVLVGRSYESTQVLPFGPWVDALRSGGVIDRIAREADFGGPFRSELARLLPQLAPGDGRAGSAGEERLRLFEALAEVVERIAREAPLLLALEDLHWADELSARLLGFLGHRLAGRRVLVLLTAREEEVAAAPALRQVLAELDREDHIARIGLGPLTREETAALTRQMTHGGRGSAVVERLGERIWEASAGNPLIAVETLRAVDERGAPVGDEPLPLPDRVRDTIVGRLERLGGRAQELASVAAVIGQEFTFALVQQAAGLDPGDAAQAVEELVARHILHVADEGLDFTHDRIREVAYARLLPPRRQLLHAAVARAIEAVYPDRVDDLSDRLAYHYAKTDLDEAAIGALTRFADRAAQAYASGAAVDALREALLRARRARSEHADGRLLGLLNKYSLSLAVLGRFREILDVLLPERERAERAQDRALASAYFSRLALTYSYLGEPGEATVWAAKALDEAERGGDDAAAGRACYVLALAAYYTGASPDGLAYARRAIAHLERCPGRADVGWLGQSQWVLGLHLFLRGEFDAALSAETDVEATAARLGGEPRLLSFAAWTSGMILATRGEWDRGIVRCREAVAHSPDPVNTALATGRLATALLEAGAAAEALPLLDRSLAQLAAFRFTQLQGLFTALQSEARLLTGDDAAGAREAADRALELTRDGRHPFGFAWAQRAVGRIARAEGNLDAAARRLADALAGFASIDARFEAARTRLELAELAHARGDLAAAADGLGEAAGALASMAVSRYDERVALLRVALDQA